MRHIAQRVAGDFPDGQILLDLRGARVEAGGVRAEPMTPNLAIQTVLRAFDRAALLPDDLGQLQAIYASTLAGKRAEAIAHAEAALAIYEQIESPVAERVRQTLAEWRAEAAKPARKPRKRRGGAG